MTATIDDVAAAVQEVPVRPALDEQSVAEQLVSQAGRRASSWSARTGCSPADEAGVGGCLEAEMSDDLGWPTSVRACPRRAVDRHEWATICVG